MHKFWHSLPCVSVCWVVIWRVGAPQMKELTLMELHKKDAEARIRSKEFAKLCVHSVPP